MSESRAAASADDIKASIAALREFHRRGLKSLKDLPGRGGYDDGAIAAQARKHGWSATMTRKSRQFADPEAGYTRQQLNELFALLRQYKPIFGPTHIGLLVTVTWPEGRADLQRRCIEGNWSKADLKAEIKSLRGPRRFGGRRRRVASEPAQALVQLDEMASSWRRWVDVARGGPDREREAVIDELPDEVAIQVSKVDKQMVVLRRLIADEQGRLRSG